MLSITQLLWIVDSGRDSMVVVFTTTYATEPITTNASSKHAHGELYSMQHYVIKFVSDLRQVGGFLQVLRFPPPIKFHSANPTIDMYL